MDNYRIAGTYLSFDPEENNKLRISKGIISIKDGLISDISPYEENVEGVEYLAENEVIYPGLLDIHSHAECNYFQIFSERMNVGTAWDNRHEWQNSKEYSDIFSTSYMLMADKWQDVLGDTGCDISVGDMIAWYSELQAVSGGTVLLQEDGNNVYYPFLDNHRRIRMIRSTSDGNDLLREDGACLKSIIRLYRPDYEFDRNNTASYAPHKDTSGWKIVDVKDKVNDSTMMETVLDIISGQNASVGGCIIHMAEGRSGCLSHDRLGYMDKDDYTALEFQTFKQELEAAISDGRVTEEQVRDTAIVLIHACAVAFDDPEVIQFLTKYRIAISWSPVSNLLLYEDTLLYYIKPKYEGALISIGSDWSPSGGKTVWDECKFVFDFIKAHRKNIDEDALKTRLIKAATINAAESIGCSKLGNIKKGNAADLMIIDTHGAQARDAFYSCDESDIHMVYVGGKPIYGSKAFYDDHIPNSDSLELVNISSKVEKLNDKYYNISGICDAESFHHCLDSFMNIAHEAGIETSELRSVEDDSYLEIMGRLRAKFCTE